MGQDDSTDPDTAPTPTPTSNGAGPTVTLPPSDPPGATTRVGGGPGPTTVGDRYEIIRPHARGGLGVVSLAQDREVHREVALKEIREDCADHPDYRARFLREAEVTGRLEHPGIVPVYGMGHRADGRPYYAMRFIRGETLKDAIRRLHKAEAGGEEGPAGPGGPTLHALVGRFVDACHAVAYAHHRKILHRDLKPINIMLGPFGETLVVDWGLAKSFDGSRSGEYPLPVEDGTLRPESGSGMTPTRYGSEIGTVGYMSPEQAAGRLTELGPPGDIYSLGATLFTLATGHPPFEGSSRAEFLGRVREGEFPPPRRVDPAVPRPLEAIILRCMALRPVDRYASAGELIDDLERWRAGEPVHAYPEPIPDRLARWARRNRTALAAAAVLMACGTIGLAGYAAQERRAARRLDLEKQAALGDVALARKSLGVMLDRLDGPGLAYLPESAPIRSQIAGELLDLYRELEGKHPADPDVRFELARARRVAANIGRSMGDFAEPRRRYDSALTALGALALADPASPRYAAERARAHQDLGELLRMAGLPRAAEREQLRAIGAIEALDRLAPGDERSPRPEGSFINLAAARLETNRPAEALPPARRAVERLTVPATGPKATTGDRLLMIYALNTRAWCLIRSGDPASGRADLDEAALAARELARVRPNIDTRFALAMVLSSRAEAHARAGEHAPALARFDEAQAILADLHARNDRLAFIERELALALDGRGAARLALDPGATDPEHLASARRDCERARDILARMAAAWRGHYDRESQLARSLAHLGRIALALGDPAAARGLLQASAEHHKLALDANPESPDDPDRRDRVLADLATLAPAKPGP